VEWLVKNLVRCYVFSNFVQLLGIYLFLMDRNNYVSMNYNITFEDTNTETTVLCSCQHCNRSYLCSYGDGRDLLSVWRQNTATGPISVPTETDVICFRFGGKLHPI